MTTIAVTGASGFLGQHVLRHLAELPVDVVAVSRHREPPIKGNRVRWVALDLHEAPADPFDVLLRPDMLLHLAWGGLPDYRGAAHLETELPAQVKFLDSMIRNGLRSLTVAGTCMEYGLKNGCLSEDMPCDPILPYPQAKLALLRELQAIKANMPFALTWARLFYMFGEGQQERSLYSQFKAAHDRGERNFDMSGGQQLRDFLPVETVARYLCDLTLTGKDAGVVNVCSGNPIRVRELVEGWAGELNWNVRLNLGVYPYPDYEPMEFWGDNRRLKALVARQ